MAGLHAKVKNLFPAWSFAYYSRRDCNRQDKVKNDAINVTKIIYV